MLILVIVLGFLFSLSTVALAVTAAALHRRDKSLAEAEEESARLNEEQAEREAAFLELEAIWKAAQERLRSTEHEKQHLVTQLQRVREELRQLRDEPDSQRLEWKEKIRDLENQLKCAKQKERDLDDEIAQLKKQIEERGRAEADSDSKTQVPQDKGETEAAGKEPAKHGGGPRGPRDGETKVVGPENPPTPPRERQQMVCQKENWRWNLEVENDGGECRELTELKVEQAPILFKLTGQEMREGYQVKSPSRGMYLAVVPETWRRDQKRSGPPPIEPESVSIAGWRAHYFSVEGDGTGDAAFLKGDGTPHEIRPRMPRFELIGNLLRDATENVGSLFGGEPPEIEGRDERAWQPAATVVIGEEGRGQHRWRTEFKPDQTQAKQRLPSEVADRRGGWYFLRFYDQSDKLIESTDFRFVRALKDIKHESSICLPPENGYGPTRVEFIHEAGCDIQARDRNIEGVEIDRQDARTVLTIPPDVACDKTSWVIRAEGAPQIEITVLVERIWWACGIEAEEPRAWVDKPSVLFRDDFRATSEKVLWVRLPRLRWTDSVYVGFERARARPYRARAEETLICIPLREFGDSEETQNSGRHPFGLWVDHANPRSVNLAEVEVAVTCAVCKKFSAFSEDEVFHHAVCNHVEDIFRPFTWEELKDEIPELPSTIYKCSYEGCPAYVKTNDRENPTSAICRHFQDEHPHVSILFRVVTDPNEIKTHVIRTLPSYRRCRWCPGSRSQEHDRGGMVVHLDAHRTNLCELR